jgi:hypothetical protein
VFAKIGYEIKENQRKDKFDKHEFVGEQIVHLNEDEKITNPRTGADAQPRWLGTTKQSSHAPDSLESMARWLTSTDNRAFARAQVNRIWYHLMGRGLVDPVDDFRVTNPASHPELLEQLADELIESRFDVRHVMRLILLSATYQLDTVADDRNASDTMNYSHTRSRRLTAEQLLDAESQVLDVPVAFAGYALGRRAGQLYGVQRVRPRDERPTPGDRFLKMFGKPDRLLACECERSDETHLGQALTLTAGESLQSMLTHPNNRIGRLLAAGMPPGEIIDQLFQWALSRDPSDAERSEALQTVAASELRTGLEDVAWAVLNSQEFLFRP